MTPTPLPLDTSPAPATVLPLSAVRPAGLDAWLATLSADVAGFVRAQGFAGGAHELVALPGPGGLSGAVMGLGAGGGPDVYGGLAQRLPQGTWRLADGHDDVDAAVLGFCLGGYRYAAFRAPKRAPAFLVPPPGTEAAQDLARGIFLARDLVNTPANRLGPAELAEAVVAVAEAAGATWVCTDGAALDAAYPAIAAVGRGSDRPPVVVVMTWRGSTAAADAPLVSLCGKGVVFDTGGYDLKPSAAMLRMKKDMGGAAILLGLARAIMARDLPLRLELRVGCVENSVSGRAMRPSDVIATRAGRSVEVGNTDAEGRLVLADLLAEAAEQQPSLLIDCATLTGAARVALGPDIPALFCADDDFATRLVAAGMRAGDPVWRLPLWDGYDPWLDSPIADLNNVSAKPFAGAIIGALFLRRFVPAGIRWAHLDAYAWNDADRPGRPEGGEAQALRALLAAIEDDLLVMPSDRNSPVT